MLEDVIAEYEFTNIINPGDIRDRITVSMSLIKKKSMVNRIVAYVKAFVEKYGN